jgi:hypothetical protein
VGGCARVNVPVRLSLMGRSTFNAFLEQNQPQLELTCEEGEVEPGARVLPLKLVYRALSTALVRDRLFIDVSGPGGLQRQVLEVRACVSGFFGRRS